MRLLVADDHEVVRAGLTAALSAEERFEIVGAVGTGDEAISVVTETRPDVAVVDMRLPDMPGHELCRRLRKASPGTAVVVLTSYLTESAIRDALRAGASAYVTKAAGLAELRTAIDDAHDGRTGAPSSVSQIVRRMEEVVGSRDRTDSPTPQQARVLELLARGLTYAAIAESLVISESTVRFHVQKLKVKLEATGRTDLVVRAIRAGLVTAEDPGADVTVPEAGRAG
ncbi:response regulator transcription factor [Pseudonocardia sediminis]|uniref:response regulator transcription factor n=1 Tax=Pseudonocardia sediminis TaxID=1397368 RepID=UPI001029D0B4|nr:response regulator transcription factor [Pseudonocardia sediminis]